jgi:hypothetical protein
MPDLLLPGNVVREIQKRKWVEQRREHAARIETLLDFDDPVCREWEPELKRLDPYLRLGRARPMAYEPGFTVRPGFYHWVRDNPTAAMTVSVIDGPDGEFVEPDSGLLAALKRNDLQNPEVYRAVIGQRAVREAEEERERELELERANSEVLELYLAKTRAQVSMNTGSPWTQNAAGKRSAKRA